MSDQTSDAPPDPVPTSPDPVRRDRSHYLYLAVLVAVAAGIVLGLVAPGVGKNLKPLGDGFVALIRMMISPIIFCTIVLGIGSVRSAARTRHLDRAATARTTSISRSSSPCCSASPSASRSPTSRRSSSRSATASST